MSASLETVWGDFLAEDFAEALAESVDGYFDGGFGHFQVCCGLGLGGGGGAIEPGF